MTLTSSSAYYTSTLTDLDIVTLFHRHTTFLTFLLAILNSLFGCVCQPMIDEYDDDDDDEADNALQRCGRLKKSSKVCEWALRSLVSRQYSYCYLH